MWSFFLFFSCSSTEKTSISEENVVLDQDGDGYLEEDCDDANSSIHPNSEEICDGVDNDCDGEIDEDVLVTYYVDSDGDGFGNEDISVESCSASMGFVSNGGDCDDSDASVYPGADEICDGIDNSCDGDIDEGLGDIFYVDSDEDGFGHDEIEACMLRDGISSVAGDCDDQDDDISPLAVELCDGIDNDCDGLIDDGVVLRLYEDFDADGFGNLNSFVELCDLLEGYVQNSSDCDDSDSQSFPGATEVCDGADNDCNSLIDDNVLEPISWYIDSDGDGFGDPALNVLDCDAPAIFYVENADDCNDDNPAISPLADEVCDGIDNNCDGAIDDALAINPNTFYHDSDGDGFGNALQTTQSCNAPTGYVVASTDCNDSDQDVFPNAPEFCNSKDDDCDGSIDEEAQNTLSWYLDSDSDGYGTTLMHSCSQPTGYAPLSGDCNDSDADIAPDQEEICDGIDNNCDGTIDEGEASDFSVYYLDSDGDGFGDPDQLLISCSQPTGYVAISGDCDDTSIDIPSSDQDCDGILTSVDCDDSDVTVGYCESCAAILSQGKSTGNGLYTIDLNGWGELEVYCDMTNFGGGWTLVGHQHPSVYFTDTTADIGLSNFDPTQTFRFGNDKIQLFEPTLAWRITSDQNGTLTDNAWFRPECVIDWGKYVGTYGTNPDLDTDCGIAYTDAAFSQTLGLHTEGNCSRGIGQNNSGNYCSIRMGSCGFSNVNAGAASPCSIGNVTTHSVKLWMK